jgi:beta-lactamase regulating signal transducer with metallopeptidase domain
MFNLLVDRCNVLSRTWAGWMGTSLLSAAIVLLVISFLWLLVRRKASPQLGYLLFLLVPLKLFVPVEVAVPTPIALWTPKASQDIVNQQATVAPSPLETGLAGPPVPDVTNPQFAVTTEAVAPSAMTAATPVASTFHDHDSDGAYSTLSPMAWLMLFWALGVLVLLVQVVYAQFRFLRRVVWKAGPMDPAAVAADFAGLLHRIGVRRQVRIAESDQIASPVVWGMFRPTLILPTGIAACLSVGQLEWVLLHELAHVRRRDLMVNCLQRVATILHFANPAIWIANRVIGRLREFACDDMAIACARGSQLESGEAFLGVMRYAALVQHRAKTSLTAAIGVFESTSRSVCFQRMSRLLDTNRRVSVKLRFSSLCLVLLMAVAVLPQIRAAANQTAGEQTASKDANEQPTAITQAATETKEGNPSANKMAAASDEPAIEATVEGRQFELIVLGSDKKPVPQAAVRISGGKQLTAEQIQVGKFIKNNERVADLYSTDTQTDAQGRLAFQMPKNMESMSVCIKQPGYGPYLTWLGSRYHPSPIPSRVVVVLEAGCSLGGVLVDPQGHPIQSVKVRAFVTFKTPHGNTRSNNSLLFDLTSDAEGKWRCDSVPVSADDVFVEFNHPEFQPLQRSLTRNGFCIPQGAQPAARIVVPRGVIVVGKVTDEAGKPISNALVRAKTVHTFSSIREAKTDEHGQYKLIGCAPQTSRIMVAAKGRATDMKEVAVGDEMEPVNFTMKPGGKVRVRVEDEKGNPVPKADVRIDQWRSDPQFFGLGNVNRQADANGVWEWNEAPADEFKVGISRPGGMSLDSKLVARDEEYVFDAHRHWRSPAASLTRKPSKP